MARPGADDGLVQAGLHHEFAVVQDPQGVHAPGDVAGAPQAVAEAPPGGVLVGFFGMVEEEAAPAFHEALQGFKQGFHGVAGVFLTVVNLTEDIEDDQHGVDLMDGVGQGVIKDLIAQIPDAKLRAWVERIHGATGVTTLRLNRFDDAAKHQLAHVELEIEYWTLLGGEVEVRLTLRDRKGQLEREVTFPREGGTP